MFDETPTRVYLQKSRHISVEIPAFTVRHHPGVPHPYENGFHQAMVCKVSEYEGPLSGVHLTYLSPDGIKAKVSPGKIMRGQIKGRGVWLGEVTDRLNVAEGVETALSVYQMTGVATVAALSAGNMASLILPPTVKFVTIAADNDAPGMKAARKALQTFTEQGFSVQIQYPPTPGHDWNDFLLARRYAA